MMIRNVLVYGICTRWRLAGTKNAINFQIKVHQTITKWWKCVTITIIVTFINIAAAVISRSIAAMIIKL
jgi:hypothetical protein